MSLIKVILGIFGIDYVSLEERVTALEQYIAERELE
jgi:hypothetical protein